MGKYAAYVRIGNELLIEKQLIQSQSVFREEIRRVLACKTKKQKMKLWQEWQEKYKHNPDHIKELVNTARNKDTCYIVANWKLIGET
jgi:hypothetical protein